MNAPPHDQLYEFCRRWNIRELKVFGSMASGDGTPSSDVDLLVSFSEDADWSLLDHVRMQQELEILFGRKVDLLTKRAVEQSHNWIRRDEILRTAQLLVTVHESDRVA